MRTLPNLDFLRACAVISVVAEHTALAYGQQSLFGMPIAWIGVVGVFLFFVHTTLVLMWSLERKPHTLDFYIRRCFRILPLVWLAGGLALLLHAPVNGTPTNYFSASSVPHRPLALLQAFFLIPNLGTAPGYLPEGVMWSLPYEFEMYAALPLLFFFIRRNFSLWPLLFFWAGICAINQAMFYGVAHNFYLCIPYFLPGVMAYVGFSRRRAFLPAWSFPVVLLGLWIGFLQAPTWRFGSVLCLAAGLLLPIFHQFTSPTLIRASHIVAKYSYGMYLSHPFAIVLGVRLLPHQRWIVQVIVVVAVTAAASVAAYHLLELPMIRLGSRVANGLSARFEQHEAQGLRIAEAEIR